jgi:hypothetical protein
MHGMASTWSIWSEQGRGGGGGQRWTDSRWLLEHLLQASTDAPCAQSVTGRLVHRC